MNESHVHSPTLMNIFFKTLKFRHGSRAVQELKCYILEIQSNSGYTTNRTVCSCLRGIIRLDVTVSTIWPTVFLSVVWTAHGCYLSFDYNEFGNFKKIRGFSGK